MNNRKEDICFKFMKKNIRLKLMNNCKEDISL